jgi:hypothetical protein
LPKKDGGRWKEGGRGAREAKRRGEACRQAGEVIREGEGLREGRLSERESHHSCPGRLQKIYTSPFLLVISFLVANPFLI